jgi:hypothetical protein
MDAKNKQEIIDELAHFRGTENYHEHKMFGYGFLYITDGVAFVRERCKCFWLMDLILSAQRIEKKLLGEDFQEWELQKLEDGTWKVTCDDGNGNLLFSIVIPYSDFPLDSVVIWYDSNVLLLPSEY